MFRTRSQKPERIDTGDYTAEEYDRFLSDIRKVNRFAGDSRALRKTLFPKISRLNSKAFSVLDVGAGSGELLRDISKFAGATGRNARLVGLELNDRSVRSILEESSDHPNIAAVRGNALSLPFPDAAFDFVISSLFAHHLTDRQIASALSEMARVAKNSVILIDLHRLPMAYVSYKVFCVVFRMSRLVREDGSLSILRGFVPEELAGLAQNAGLESFGVARSFPFRLVLASDRVKD